MKISPVNLYTPKAKTKVSYKGGHPHPPVGNDEGNKTEALSKHNKKRVCTSLSQTRLYFNPFPHDLMP